MGRSGFVSGGRSWGGAVVCRVSRSGEVWAFRAVRAGGSPAPACLFVPFASRVLASLWARQVAALGGRVWVRRARRCASAWEVKLALAPGLSPARAWRGVLPPVPVWSALAVLGV